MESAQWVIAISTAIIAIVLLTLAVFWIKVGLTLRRDLDIFSEGVERQIQALDTTWRNTLSLDSLDLKEPRNEHRRIFPRVLQSVIFATALWKNLQKRR